MKATGSAAGVSNGFTLLELLVSMSIIAVLVVLVFGAFRVSVRAWEKGEADIEVNHRRRVVLDLLKRQLTSLTLKNMQPEAEKPVFFKGGPRSIEFTSYVSLAPGKKYGLTYVKYTVMDTPKGGNRLGFYEKYAVFTGLQGPQFDALEDDDYYELIPEAAQINFQYLKAGKTEPSDQWQEQWGTDDEGLPAAVLITFQQDSRSTVVKVMVRNETSTHT